MDESNQGDRPEGEQPGTDYRAPAPFLAAVSRRRFFQVGGALAGAAAVGVGVSQLAGAHGQGHAAATGRIADLKHVVILMQENRSFDHYYGTLRGVRGFADRQALTWQNGNRIFQQPDPARTDLGYLLPYNLTDQIDGDLDHSWDGDHLARSGGLWNNWV